MRYLVSNSYYICFVVFHILQFHATTFSHFLTSCDRTISIGMANSSPVFTNHSSLFLALHLFLRKRKSPRLINNHRRFATYVAYVSHFQISSQSWNKTYFFPFLPVDDGFLITMASTIFGECAAIWFRLYTALSIHPSAPVAYIRSQLSQSWCACVCGRLLSRDHYFNHFFFFHRW